MLFDIFQTLEDAMGGDGKKRGEENLTKDGVLGPTFCGTFSTHCPVSPAQKSRPDAVLEGSRDFPEGASVRTKSTCSQFSGGNKRVVC